MDKGKGKEEQEEEDNQASLDAHQAEQDSASDEEWIRDLKLQMEEGSAKAQQLDVISDFSEEETINLTKEQIELAYELCREGVASDEIELIMGVEEGTVESLELRRVLVEAEVSIAMALDTQEDTQAETQSQDDEEGFEVYDPVKWQVAIEGSTIGEALDEEGYSSRKSPGWSKGRVLKGSEAPRGSPTSETPPTIKDFEEEVQSVPTIEDDFVRALKDSRTGSKPYFRKGDILRVINKSERANLDDGHFELLPLKPPGEAGQALVQEFEPADVAAVEAVRKEARTAKEIDSFQRAVDWEDR